MEEEKKDTRLIDYFNGDELAASVWKGKYALDSEVTPDDMHKRMAKEFARVEDKYSKIEQGNTNPGLSEYYFVRSSLKEAGIYNLFKDFKYIIPQGSVMSQLGADSIGSLSNCFVVGQPTDSYGGIFQKDQEMAQLMKRRGGVGIDISPLRPEGVATSNAAKSSTGAISFMNRFSNTTREVAQNGRRGALMISIDIKHPDVMEFIKIKRDLTQITGANISIKLNDEFMKAVEADEDYILRWPCTASANIEYPDPKQLEYDKLLKVISDDPSKEKFIKKIKAKEYYDELCKSAHNVAEPGQMFWDRMVNYSPDGVYPQFRQITTNPCSEIGMQPYDACRLIAHNLFHYVTNPFTKDAEFDFALFYTHNYEAMRLSDDLIDLEVEHIDRILMKLGGDIDKEVATGELSREEVNQNYSVEVKLWNKVRKTALASRRTGLGITGLGDTLAALGLKYDSDEGLEMIESIMHAKMESELDCTIDMSILRGTFEGWSPELEYGGEGNGNNDFYEALWEMFPEQVTKMCSHGRRNVSWSTVAPTGSLSIMAKAIMHSNISSGLEPVFAPYYMRRKKVNPGQEGSRVDFTDQNGDTWQEYPVVMGAFKDWSDIYLSNWEDIIPSPIKKPVLEEMTKEQMQSLYEASPWFGSTANDINWVRRVEIQSVIQKYITHSISSTINLPEDVTEAEVTEIYLQSWKMGLKGITVYRDGSRSGVLVSNDAKPKTGFEYIDAVKRPKELDAHVHISTTKDVEYKIIIGLMDDKPYEIFIDESDNQMSGVGVILKKAKGDYYFKKGDITVDISSSMTDEQAAITRLVSTSLRHGADIRFIVEQLRKADGDMFSFTKSLARVLKKYIPEGAKATVNCNDCGSENVIFQEGCNLCLECGSSKCG
tara:strand:+ start:19776 stop:22427 length:2652 start_codon:yes stop_codon:yes gene_type:complete